ncbi:MULTISPECIES: FliA/WhiG family RNA polymerase sigma factor [unclassified Photobacterium]|uniref:FliA/WhiG family RNA polymerase sigma factor n=1 Tax=unclassified Photobacterium TaxID=2628852 RepID=UPI001EE09B33|nr:MULTISPECIES: FliA/WhiG family RNA polymerase sigma factor [unclassified Photobacterium]MCG3864007.1 FliA/WhiG family RNA polymerase sigma factor [Photobacterium sp. Ph6]MCG3875465.1 FliA/WhiG family RNA polymerase sigma factor [Photobacterium sp. Ph5]
MLDHNPTTHYEPGTAPSPQQDHIDEDLLIRHHLVLVKRVVNQLRHHTSSHCSYEDMQQIGLIGLLEAARRYGNVEDPQFPAFAVCRIRGAILDELRRLDWRSRHTRQQAHELNDITRDLMKQLGRQPTEAEITSALGIDSENYQLRLQASMASEMQSLDQLLEAGKELDAPLEYNGVEHEHMRRTLEYALTQLSKREQLLLTLFYQHELNLHEIALVLNLTPPRICQLHKQALKSLNHNLSA